MLLYLGVSPLGNCNQSPICIGNIFDLLILTCNLQTLLYVKLFHKILIILFNLQVNYIIPYNSHKIILIYLYALQIRIYIILLVLNLLIILYLQFIRFLMIIDLKLIN